MKYTIEGLMEAVCCPKWPERWREIFDDAMAEYDRCGCRLADPQLYRQLHEKYGAFHKNLDTFMEAAAETAKDEPLARFLTLLDKAVQDRENIYTDYREFTAPSVPEGKSALAYNMVTGLVFAGTMDGTYRRLAARGIPEDRILYCIRAYCGTVDAYRSRHNGEPGFHLFNWHQLNVDGRLANFGTLIMEISSKCRGNSCVFANEAGEQISLADGIVIHKSGFPFGAAGCKDEDGSWEAAITETEDAYIGYPVLHDGSTDKKQVTLPKAQWKQILKKDDPIIRLHIPAKVKFDAASIDKALADMCEYLDKYFPEITTRTFCCSSWMMDPQLETLMGSGSNVVKFQQRFRVMPTVYSGSAVFYFVFSQPQEIPASFDHLPQDSSLQRKLVEHYKSGQFIHELEGYFVYNPEK